MPLRMLINIELTPPSSPAFWRVRKMRDTKSPPAGRNYPLSSRTGAAGAVRMSAEVAVDPLAAAITLPSELNPSNVDRLIAAQPTAAGCGGCSARTCRGPATCPGGSAHG